MQSTEFKINQTAIPGLLEIDVSLIEDERGFFQEKFQKAKLVAAGFPEEFEIVQQNISFNKHAGTMRGIHAEPWDKYISIVSGRVFAAFVEMRKGDNFGKVVTLEVTPTKAVFVPRGVGNSYQTLEDNVAYQYFVNAHWSAGERYIGANMFDPDLNIAWPIPKDKSIFSDRDAKHPMIKDIKL